MLAAFEELVVRKPYQQISVGNIVNKADVGRSTFYDHYKNKDALLRESLVGVVNLLAQLTTAECDPDKIAHLLEHFREVGDVARSFFNEPSQELIVAAIAEAIEEANSERRDSSASAEESPVGVPPEFAARLAAETITAMIKTWLNAEAVCAARELACSMNRAALAIVVDA